MKMIGISVVVPTLNEKSNLKPLIERIGGSLKIAGFDYEIIIVDDHSTDSSNLVIQSLTKKFPIRFYTKRGLKGKAQSLIEGFSYAKYPLIAMIDADLQYPPEAIPKMIEKINSNVDIVIANRLEHRVGFRRKVLSYTFRHFFGKFLHGFTCDVQSGLKVFKKEIVERIKLHPSQWTFDLEFLVKARNAGYKIDTVDIAFQKRHSGKPKIGLITASIEMSLAALNLALSRSEIVPFHPNVEKVKGKGFHYKGIEFIHYSQLRPRDSAFHRLSIKQIVFILFLITIIVFSIISNWHAAFTGFIAILTLLYFADLLFNFFLIYRSFSKSPEIQITGEEIARNDEWPTYTILCPLYHE